MASNPEIPPPDTINPQSPAEIPGETAPAETPFEQPAEIVPDTPNVDEPHRAPSELPRRQINWHQSTADLRN
ncbi:hypothetical protein A6768_11890 [Sphingobium yanoikuyae]|uniref:Uncharacterized protein n=1 Tax=Sphingobium yanoikuyae TaxID=13690 RepID=A0A291MZN6_SPHYA|nr:hypothetical protein A6768_11890 [Sphingobium yanoikuyae]